MSAYGVIVIGAGVAGYSAAIRLAQLGAKVCIIEKAEIGGTCLNRGCIPTKVFLSSVALLSSLKKADDMGIKVAGVSLDFERIIQKKQKVVENLVKGVEYLLKNNQVEIIKGAAKIISPDTVQVSYLENTIKINAKHIVIATGSEPDRPNWIRFGDQIITSDELLNLNTIPKSLMIIGGGAIGCEFAFIFSALGAQVTLVEIMNQILPSEEEEITSRLFAQMEKAGIKVYTKVKLDELFANSDAMVGKLSTGEEISAEKVLVAMGRVPNTKGLGLEAIGVKTEHGKIHVSERLKTNIEGIYAIGDVVRGPMYAHKAALDGITVAEIIMDVGRGVEYSSVPNCIFTIPEVASVGLKEEDARKKYKVNVGRFMFAANGRAQTLGDTEGFVKIVGEEQTGRILGVHIIGREATELINQASQAMKNNLTVKQLADSVFAHPTLSECIKEAAGDVTGEAIHKVKKC
ncbi:MAG: dihydrolipoyl dehydrogenase [bacterium]